MRLRPFVSFFFVAALVALVGCKVGGSAVQGSTGDNDTIANPVLGLTKSTNFDAVSISWNQEIRRALVSYAEGNTPPDSCASGTLVSAIPTTDHQVAISGLKDDTVYSFRICSVGASDSAKELGFVQGAVRTRSLAGKLAGRLHFCQVGKNTKVRCWGYGPNGQLAMGDHQSRMYEAESPFFTDVVQLAAGYYQTCALLGDTSVSCIGSGAYGLAGDGSGLAYLGPTFPTGLNSGVKQISTGPEHDCVVMIDGTVRCWGRGLYGRLGDGQATDHSVLAPTAISGLTDIKEVATIFQATCVLGNDGNVRCFGRCSAGYCGRASADSATPLAAVTLEAPAVSISGGETHFCALLKTGTVWCWGANPDGELGNNSVISSATPVQAMGVTNAVQLSVGSYFTCARLADGGVKCWGAPGTVGDVAATNRLVPTDVPGISGVRWVVGGYKTACAWLSDNTTKCWGSNAEASIGDGTYAGNSYAPTAHTLVDGCKIRVRVYEDLPISTPMSIPAGCKTVRVYAWGGGGGGGATVGGGRGGYGGYIINEYAVQQGDYLWFTLGRGGNTAVAAEAPAGAYGEFSGGNGGTGPGGVAPGTGTGTFGIGGGVGGTTLNATTAQSGSQGYMGGGGGGGSLVSAVRYAGGSGGGATAFYLHSQLQAPTVNFLSVAAGGGGGGAFGSAASGVSPDGGSGCSANGASPTVVNAGGGGGGGRCLGGTAVAPTTQILNWGIGFGSPGSGGTSRSAGNPGGLVFSID